MTEDEIAAAEQQYKEDPDVITAQIGFQLQRVMGTSAGKKLEELARTQIDEGISRLLELDIEDDVKEFRKVRLGVLVAQQALTWIVNTIAEGEEAARRIHEEEGR